MTLMNRLHAILGRTTRLPLVLGLASCLWATTARANPWVPIANPVFPAPGNGLPTAQQVPGKDFSDVRDRDAAGVLDPERDVAWDGSGGVRNSFDYTGSRALLPQDIGVDGVSAEFDALFGSLRANQSSLLFSVTNDPRIHYVLPTGLPNSVAGSGVWATATDIDAMNPPVDTDALEIWGSDNVDDSNRYSLDGDPFVNFPAAGAKGRDLGLQPGR